RLGMIVSELVTNAARHAFGADGGEIRVELKSSSNFVECCVADDGTASAQISPARGLKIVEALVDGLGGRIERRHSSKGRTGALTFQIGLGKQIRGQEDPRFEPRPGPARIPSAPPAAAILRTLRRVGGDEFVDMTISCSLFKAPPVRGERLVGFAREDA